jgi:N-hydroxyarylamine O-acetyltransferase
MLPPFDLEAYLARIGYAGPRAPQLAVLEELILRHQASIPFENLDIQLGVPIRLDLPSLEAKLVRGFRGGYCFEQNTLFAAALSALGFAVETLEARVRPTSDAFLPRTHMTLRVTLPEGAFLCDAGFGASGPLVPVPFDGAAVERHGAAVRLSPEGRWTVLQGRTAAGWTDLYAVEREPAFAVDYEVANHFTSTSPESRFVVSLTAQLSTPEACHVLRNRVYTVTRGGKTVEKRVESPEELLALLADVFGLRFPEGTRFRNPSFE